MTETMSNSKGLGVNRGRLGAWSGAAALLLLPLIAMQFTDEVNWTVSDFIFAALMIGVAGLIMELTVRTSDGIAYRIAVGVAVAASFLTVWVNGAVGMIGDEDNPFNLLFGGVLLLALLGAIVARFRPAGMAAAMLAAALAQLVIGLIGLSSDLLGGVLSAAFAGLWLLSAAMFWNASRKERPTQ